MSTAESAYTCLPSAMLRAWHTSTARILTTASLSQSSLPMQLCAVKAWHSIHIRLHTSIANNALPIEQPERKRSTGETGQGCMMSVISVG